MEGEIKRLFYEKTHKNKTAGKGVFLWKWKDVK